MMLVCGAPVPFAFTKFGDELKRRERDLKAAMDDNDNDYYEDVQKRPKYQGKSTPDPPKIHMLRPLESMRERHSYGTSRRLDKEWLELQYKLHKLSCSNRNLEAWVLQGELYIEGIVSGEAMERVTAERITVI